MFKKFARRSWVIPSMRLALIIALLGTISFSANAADPSLILYLPLDGGAGEIAKDASNYENDGQIVDAQWADRNSGKCLELASENYVEVPEISAYDVSSAVSLMAWVNTTSVTTWARIIDKSQWQDNGFDLALSQVTHAPLFEFFVNGTTSQALATTPVDDGEWHFVAGTFGNKTLKIYVDSVMENEVTSTGDVDIKLNDWPIRLGCEANDSKGQPYVGMIDEVAIFDRELSADELDTVFQKGINVSPVASKGKLAIVWGILK